MSIYSATLYRRKCKYPPRKRRRRGAFRKRSRIASEAPCRCAGGRKWFRTRGLRAGIPRSPKPMARRRNRDKKTNPFRRFAFIRAGRRTKIGATSPRKELLISMKESTFCGNGSAQYPQRESRSTKAAFYRQRAPAPPPFTAGAPCAAAAQGQCVRR